jgi:replicative DNA helicase
MDTLASRRNGRSNTSGAGGARGGAGGGAGAGGGLSSLYQRPMPYATEAEMGLLGAMLLDPKVAPDVLESVSAAMFFDGKHALIFRAIVDVYEKDPSADMVPIVDALRSRGELDSVGGREYLLELARDTPSAAGWKHYAHLVADKHRLRQLIEAGDAMVYAAMHAGDYGLDGSDKIIDDAERAVFAVAASAAGRPASDLAVLMQREIDRLESADGKALLGLPTGYPDLDAMMLGLQGGELIIMAARPSMGKTSLAMTIAEQVARGGRTPLSVGLSGGDEPPVPVVVFSLEMSEASLVQRMLSSFAGVDGQRIRTGALGPEELRAVREAAKTLGPLPLVIDDTPAMSITQLRARARRMVSRRSERERVRLIVVDYLQLLTSSGTGIGAGGGGNQTRQDEVSAVSRGLKALAKELDVPILCLAQLNRASEQREGHRPRMSDLRESGSIEQDADVVMLLHREDYYHRGEPAWNPEHPEFNEENRDKIGTAELIIAKQRNGPTGTVRLTWDAATTRFKSHTGLPDDRGPTGGRGAGGFGGRVGGDGGPVFGNPFEQQ